MSLATLLTTFFAPFIRPTTPTNETTHASIRMNLQTLLSRRIISIKLDRAFISEGGFDTKTIKSESRVARFSHLVQMRTMHLNHLEDCQTKNQQRMDSSGVFAWLLAVVNTVRRRRKGWERVGGGERAIDVERGRGPLSRRVASTGII